MSSYHEKYAQGNPVFDSGVPCSELLHILDDGQLPGRTVLELGCGTGTNAVELARRGYTVTAVDYVPLAIELAREKARQANVTVDFRVADVTQELELGGPFDIIFDRGLYHYVRDLPQGLTTLLKNIQRCSVPKALWLCLAGSANSEPGCRAASIHEHELRAELEPYFEIIQLREFRAETNKPSIRPLMWSVLMRRKT